MAVSVSSFMTFCKTLVGTTLPTAGGRANFELSKVTDETVYYTPLSTGKERGVKKRYLHPVLDRYARTGSLKPGDYQNITVNASYTVAIIKLYLERGAR
ncbi:MAG: hypothetical protein HYX80_03435 [Chloroflexi bacterium]|nr:hypothetical protein [Chloroflexota bacterium]